MKLLAVKWDILLERYTRSVQKVSSYAIQKIETFLKRRQDTRNIVHRMMVPQSPSKQAPWDFTQFSQLQHNDPSALVAEATERILP